MNLIIRNSVIGKYAWHVCRGHGSFITMQFGLPSLLVRQPRPARPESEDIVVRHFNRRKIIITGEYSLWIQGSWQIFDNNNQISNSDSDYQSIDEALKFIDGQRLDDFDVSIDHNSTKMRFDLGGSLTIARNADDTHDDVQWTLYQGNDEIISVPGNRL